MTTILEKAEEQDVLKTFEILEQVRLEEEDHKDMEETLRILSKALSPSEHQIFHGNIVEKNVKFSEDVKILSLPYEERIDARNARKKYWQAGPYHDEIWDGDLGEFREHELTVEELQTLLKRKSRVVTSFKKFFSKRKVNIDARSHARRRKFIDDEEGEAAELIDARKMKRKSSILSRFLPKRTSSKTDMPSTINEEKAWIASILEASEKLKDEDDQYHDSDVDDNDDSL